MIDNKTKAVCKVIKIHSLDSSFHWLKLLFDLETKYYGIDSVTFKIFAEEEQGVHSIFKIFAKTHSTEYDFKSYSRNKIHLIS